MRKSLFFFFLFEWEHWLYTDNSSEVTKGTEYLHISPQYVDKVKYTKGRKTGFPPLKLAFTLIGISFNFIVKRDVRSCNEKTKS